MLINKVTKEAYRISKKVEDEIMFMGYDKNGKGHIVVEPKVYFKVVTFLNKVARRRNKKKMGNASRNHQRAKLRS